MQHETSQNAHETLVLYNYSIADSGDDLVFCGIQMYNALNKVFKSIINHSGPVCLAIYVSPLKQFVRSSKFIM